MARTRSSTRQKAVNGTLRVDRLHGGTVPALGRLPPAPATLTPAGRTAWTNFGRSAIQLGTLSEYDLGLLELLARTWSSCVDLEALLARDGLVLESANGIKKSHPGLQALDRARALAHRMLTDLGLSPPGRERITIDPQKDGRRPWEDDPAEQFFS